MRLIPVVLLVAAGIGAYRWLTGRGGADAPAVGPEGRFWWAKLLVGLAAAVALLALLIWTYVTYMHQS